MSRGDSESPFERLLLRKIEQSAVAGPDPGNARREAARGSGRREPGQGCDSRWPDSGEDDAGSRSWVRRRCGWRGGSGSRATWFAFWRKRIASGSRAECGAGTAMLISRWLTLTKRGHRQGFGAEYPTSLRSEQRDFYKLWLGPENGLYLCLLPCSVGDTRRGAGGKAKPWLPEAAATAGERKLWRGCKVGGSPALYMAKHHGVTVRAFNISREQIQYAQAQAKKEGLTRQVEFIEDDYRKTRRLRRVCLGWNAGACGPRALWENRRRLSRRPLGGPDADFCISSGAIGRRLSARGFGNAFSPGAYAPTCCASRWRFSNETTMRYWMLRNLRLHYAKTLEHWLERYERAVDLVITRCSALNSFARGGSIWRG